MPILLTQRKRKQEKKRVCFVEWRWKRERQSVQQVERNIAFMITSKLKWKSRTLFHSHLQSQNPWYCPTLVVMFQSRLLAYHRAYRFSALLLRPTYLPIVPSHPCLILWMEINGRMEQSTQIVFLFRSFNFEEKISKTASWIALLIWVYQRFPRKCFFIHRSSPSSLSSNSLGHLLSPTDKQTVRNASFMFSLEKGELWRITIRNRRNSSE